jgi:hypothetical protein
LNAQAVEEPWGVGRDGRRLIGPVIERIIAEQSDIAHEDSGVDVDAVKLVDGITAVGLGDVAVSGVEIPLAARGLASLRGVVSEYIFWVGPVWDGTPFGPCELRAAMVSSAGWLGNRRCQATGRLDKIACIRRSDCRSLGAKGRNGKSVVWALYVAAGGSDYSFSFS